MAGGEKDKEQRALLYPAILWYPVVEEACLSRTAFSRAAHAILEF